MRLTVNPNTTISLERTDAADWIRVMDRKVAVAVDTLRNLGADFAGIHNVLVIGGGNGAESVSLARMLDQARVVAVDIVDYRLNELSTGYDMVRCDARDLPFADATFDWVYSYHALEHIAAPQKVLAEARRVTRPDGWLYVGTPNRSRLVGHINTADITMRQRLKWNLGEWRDRVLCRWTNEQGAHAGFARARLLNLVRDAGYAPVSDATLSYYEKLYPNHLGAIRFLERARLSSRLFPSVYVAAQNTEP